VVISWSDIHPHADPRARANALARLRSAGDLAVLDVPWRFALGNGFIAIRSGQAVPGPGLPDPDNADQLLSCWQEAFEEELGSLDDMGGRVLPGMLSMLGEQFDSVVFPVLKLLYRLPDEERLDTGSLMSSLGADASHVAAGVLANLGEELPLYRETTQQWLLIDLLTALRAGNLRQNLTQSTMEAIRSHADDLWRSDHPATAGTIEATAAAMRDTDKALAKQLRRSAHKARTCS
jgi:hypothetical protein